MEDTSSIKNTKEWENAKILISSYFTNLNMDLKVIKNKIDDYSNRDKRDTDI